MKYGYDSSIQNRFFDQLSEDIKGKFVGLILRGGRGFVVSSINKSVSAESLVMKRNALYMYFFCDS